MLKHILLVPVLLSLMGTGCVEHYEFKYLTDSAIPHDADTRGADGLADIASAELTDIQEIPPDSLSDALPDLLADLPDMATPDQLDSMETDEHDGVTDLLDLVDEEAPCLPDCIDLECGDDGCGGSCGECDDGNDCTEDSCNAGLCEHVNLSDSDCDDPDPCTSSEGYCEDGVCKAASLPLNVIADFETCWCAEDADCLIFDTDPCDDSTMVCDPELDDEDHPHCYFKEIVIPTCDDGISCTADSCSSETGCINVPDDAPCNGDNPCIKGTCSSIDGCQYEPLSVGGCNDDNMCTVGDSCLNGSCAPGEALDCDDSIACTDDACLPESGCTHEAVDTICDDSNPCTDDACDPLEGCQHSNSNLPCDDDQACTELDTCSGAICAGTPIACDDGNECTVDACDPDSGQCGATPVANELAQECDHSSDQCTEDIGHCVDGSCAGTAIDCEDTNICTDVSCDPESGCIYVNNDLGCDDNDACTLDDFCAGGECNPGPGIAVACLDYDHDGIANGDDSCPMAFDGQELDLNGNGIGDACESAAVAPPKMRSLGLSAGGVSPTARRTNEVVDVPLANGLADLGAFGYLPLDGDASMPNEKNGGGGQLIGTSPGSGAFDNSEGGALIFDGNDSIYFAGVELPDISTLCIWIRPDEVHDFAFGSMFAQGPGGKFEFKGEEGKVVMVLRSSPSDTYVLATTKSLKSEFFDGGWHQLCFQWNVLDKTGGLYLDGGLWPTSVTAQGSPVMSTAFLPQWYIGSFYDGQLGINVGYYKGRLDEMLITTRPMTPMEIGTYYQSKAPFATPFVPGAQKDFDDVRIVDVQPLGGAPAVFRRSRIVGVRQHSDTPCPAGTSPASWPHREDLCGVVAYWPLGEDFESVVGNYHLTQPFSSESAQVGRFGDKKGATVFYDGGELQSTTISAASQIKDDNLSIELWYFVKDGDLDGGYLLGLPKDQVSYVTALRVLEDGTVQWTLASSSNVALLQTKGHRNRWVHVALTYDGTEAILYVDGISRDRATLTGNILGTTMPMLVGAAGDSDELKGRAIIDEVIIHDTAKSADYFFNRTHPALPSVRFLAGTEVDNAGTAEAPEFPVRKYRIGWGDANAVLRSPFVSAPGVPKTCYGLLNECLGYVGWWTFDELDDGRTPDLAGQHLHAFLKGSVAALQGASGTALQLDGSSFFEVAHEPSLQLPVFAAEAVAQGSSGALISRGKLGDGNFHNYLLTLGHWGTMSASFTSNESQHILAQYNAAIPSDVFHALGGTRDGAHLLALLDGETVAAVETSAAPGETLENLWLGASRSGAGNPTLFFDGALDEVRIMSRALAHDELLSLPKMRTNLGPFIGATGAHLDSDGDGILDDGDGSLIIGDNPCKGGNTAGCDDNAVDDANGDQSDDDGDGVGTVIDNCPDDANPTQSDHDGNGIGDACDPTFNTDWDHDGVGGGEDPCPFAFDGAHEDYDGDGHPDACKPYLEGFQNGQSIWMENFGETGRRTTNEVVDMPLKSGTLDASTLLYLPFENNALLDESPNTLQGISVHAGEFSYTPGFQKFGDAIDLQGGCLTFPEPFTYPLSDFTIMAWVETGSSAYIFDDGSHPGEQAYGVEVRYDPGKVTVTMGDGNSTCSQLFSTEPWNFGDWHHVALSMDSGEGRLFVDGAPQLKFNCTFSQLVDDGKSPTVGCDNQVNGSNSKHRTDELLLFNRALLPGEIEDYYYSMRPFGSPVAPGAQADFDDVRVTEFPFADETGDMFVTRTQVIGIRPHSDSECPPDVPDSTLADRDDLCGVAGFWRLDWASGDEVTQGPQSSLKLQPGPQNPWQTFGRFGSPDGGTRFTNRDQALTVASPPELNPGTGSFTIEAWLRVPDISVGSVLYPVDKVDGNNFGYQMTYSVNSGFFGCQWFSEPGQMIVMSDSLHSLNDRQWHHVGCVLDRSVSGSTTAIVYVDGIPVKQQTVNQNFGTLDSNTPFRVGWANNPGDLSQEIDEVLYHSVAKSRDYFYYRARPSVPKLRFLANSTTVNQGNAEAPQYPMRGYELKWGNPDALASQPLTVRPGGDDICFGVANECLGYVGWWRLEGMEKGRILDSGPNHLHGEIVGNLAWRYLGGQFGLAGSATDQLAMVGIGTSPVLLQGRGTWESTFRPGTNINGNLTDPLYLLSRTAGNPDGGYAAGILTDGRLNFYRQAEDGTQVSLNSMKSSWSNDQTYHAAMHSGDGSNTLALNYHTEEEQSDAPGGFGGAGLGLNFIPGKFNGTVFEYRYMSRVLEPDEYLRKMPLRAALNY